MKNFLILLLSICFIYSCDECRDCPDDCPDNCIEEPVVPLDPTCDLDLKLTLCQNSTCQVTNPFAGIEVGLYASREDAIDGINELVSRETDENGMIEFVNTSCYIIYTRIDLGDFGTHIEVFSLAEQAINSEEIRIVDGFLYNNEAEGAPPQSHISFSNPFLFQQSNYIRFEIPNHISYDIPEYTDNTLSVRLQEQIDDNSFMVVETIDRIEGSLNLPFYPDTETVINKWTFHGDSITVSPYNDEYFTSFIWNLSEAFEGNEDNGFTFSLIRPTDPIIDMANDDVSESMGWGTFAAEDYSLSNQVFGDLIVNGRSYVGWDGPKKMVFYNRTDGVIRSIDFNGMALITHGFDLVL